MKKAEYELTRHGHLFVYAENDGSPISEWLKNARDCDAVYFNPPGRAVAHSWIFPAGQPVLDKLTKLFGKEALKPIESK